MRRTDREVTGLENILAILDKCEIIRIALSVDNKPYIVPLNFAYETKDEKVFIYMHCAPEGRKLDMIAKNNNVCFEADCSFKVVSSDTACDYFTEYESVIGEGAAFILIEEKDKIHALDLLVKRYGFEGEPQYQPKIVEKVKVLQISVSAITGKRKLQSAFRS